ncbi:MAG: hypothetical protein K2R98_07575, partial [Gemmataceae bacterium]|nr:hypothetical protein [Gemmataceae bacterium]
MAFFHLRRPPGCTWPALPPGPLAPVWAAYLGLEQTQWLDRGAIERHQLAQVRTLLNHSLAHVPYYRERLTAAGVVPDAVLTMDDFRKVPILERTTYQQRLSDFCAESLPAGTRSAGEVRTSGTSGLPVKVFQTDVVHLWWMAFCLRDLEWAGIDPRGSLAGVRTAPSATTEQR